jgi:hypothetical protein
MNDLRKDINAVFARQQDQLGNGSSAGNRMLRAASAERRGHRQLRTALAGVALVLIAAAAVGVSVVIRALHPTNVVGSPHSKSIVVYPPLSRTTLPANGLIAVSANPKNVAGGEAGDIYLVSEGAAARRIIGFDGDGVAQACPRFSPDGTRLAYGEARASGPVTNLRGVWPVSNRAVVAVRLNGHGDASAPMMRVSLPAGPGQIPCPKWSPSGRHVAFRVGSELWVADAASGRTAVFPVTAGIRVVSRRVPHRRVGAGAYPGGTYGWQRVDNNRGEWRDAWVPGLDRRRHRDRLHPHRRAGRWAGGRRCGRRWKQQHQAPGQDLSPPVLLRRHLTRRHPGRISPTYEWMRARRL